MGQLRQDQQVRAGKSTVCLTATASGTKLHQVGPRALLFAHATYLIACDVGRRPVAVQRHHCVHHAAVAHKKAIQPQPMCARCVL